MPQPSSDKEEPRRREAADHRERKGSLGTSVVPDNAERHVRERPERDNPALDGYDRCGNRPRGRSGSKLAGHSVKHTECDL